MPQQEKQTEKEPLLPSDFYDLQELADQLGVEIHYLYNEIKRKHLTAYKFGKAYKVTKEDAQEYVESKKVQSDSSAPNDEE